MAPERRALPGVFLRELPLPLHVEHQISSVHIFNNKEEPADRRDFKF